MQTLPKIDECKNKEDDIRAELHEIRELKREIDARSKQLRNMLKGKSQLINAL